MAINPTVSRGVLDEDLALCTAQAIPVDGATDVSENTYDTGLTVPTYGVGQTINIKIIVTTAFAHSAGDPTLAIRIATDGDAALGSATALQALLAIPSGIAAGTIYQMSVPAAALGAQERYIGLSLVPSSTQFTAGAIDAYIDVN